MAENWDSHCNRKAYGQDGNFIDNREKVEFKSGRTIYYLKNQKPKKSHALNFTFDDKEKIDGKTEFEWFLYWYENTIKSGTLPFYFDDVITHNGEKQYILQEPPSWTGQKNKEVSVIFEEK